MARSAPSNTTRNESPAVSISRPPKPAEHAAHDVVVHGQGPFEGHVSGVVCQHRGVDDVGEEDRGCGAPLLSWPGIEAGPSGPVDHHELLVAIHPGDVPRREVEDLIGLDDQLLAVVGANTHPPVEDDAAVEELARGGADLRPRVLLPTPARLEDMRGDDRAGEAHLVSRSTGVGRHRLGLAEVADFNTPPHANDPSAASPGRHRPPRSAPVAAPPDELGGPDRRPSCRPDGLSHGGASAWNCGCRGSGSSPADEWEYPRMHRRVVLGPSRRSARSRPPGTPNAVTAGSVMSA